MSKWRAGSDGDADLSLVTDRRTGAASAGDDNDGWVRPVPAGPVAGGFGRSHSPTHEPASGRAMLCNQAQEQGIYPNVSARDSTHPK